MVASAKEASPPHTPIACPPFLHDATGLGTARPASHPCEQPGSRRCSGAATEGKASGLGKLTPRLCRLQHPWKADPAGKASGGRDRACFFLLLTSDSSCEPVLLCPCPVQTSTGPSLHSGFLQRARWRPRWPLQTSASGGCFPKGPRVWPKGFSWCCYLRTLVRALLTLEFPRSRAQLSSIRISRAGQHQPPPLQPDPPPGPQPLKWLTK